LWASGSINAIKSPPGSATPGGRVYCVVRTIEFYLLVNRFSGRRWNAPAHPPSQSLLPTLPPVAREAQRLQIFVTVVTAITLGDDVIDLCLVAAPQDSPTPLALPIIASQDSFPDRRPVFAVVDFRRWSGRLASGSTAVEFHSLRHRGSSHIHSCNRIREPAEILD